LDATIKDGKLTVTMPLSAGTPSKTGKTLIVFTTGGFVAVCGDYKISINVIKGR
jgi:hypothetical protein